MCSNVAMNVIFLEKRASNLHCVDQVISVDQGVIEQEAGDKPLDSY